MPWVIPVVAWVKHAIRALSPTELKRILEIKWDMIARFSNQERPSGEILFVNLQRTLPELLLIRGDTISLRQDFENFGEIWSRHHVDRGCPDKYIANVCLGNLRYVFQNSTSETQATGDDEAGVSRSNFDGVLTKYATRYCMEHYSRAWPKLVLGDASFRLLLGERKHLNLDAWARYLASNYWSCEIGEHLRNKALPHTLERVFKVSLLESSYLSYRIVTLPLSLEDDFDCLLLGLASEIVEEVKFYDMVEITCKDVSQSTCSGTLTRVIATASDDRRSKLFAAHNDFLGENDLQILLTCIAVGNSSAVAYLLAREVAASLDETQTDWSSSLGTPLQVECEYGDSELVTEVLKMGSPWLSQERSYPWNAMHVACHLAWAKIVDTLSQLQWSCGYNPLLVTSARGLLEISKSIADTGRLCEIAEPPRDGGSSPVRLASKYGFLYVLEWLLDSRKYKISPESHEDSTTRLALRSGNEKVAIRVLRAVLSESPTAYDNSEDAELYSDDSEDTDFYSNYSDDSVPLIATKKWEGAALVEAAQCGSGPAVFDILLRISDPDVRDSKGRTPLMIAASNGSVVLVQRLLKFKASVGAKDDHGQTVMHHACDQGHMSVVEVLIKNKRIDLKAQNKFSRTPMTAAIRAGHQHVVKLLLPEITNEALKPEFVLTAAYGQDQILKQILKFATELDFQAQEEYVNAKAYDSGTALHTAASFNYPRIVQFLLLRGAKIDQVDTAGMTPLAAAVAMENPSLQSLEVLLNAGASTEVENRRGRLPLTQAIFDKKEAVVRLLLEKGAKPQLSYKSDSLLNFTMTVSSLAVLKALLGHLEKATKSAKGSLLEYIPTPTEALRSAIRCGKVATLDTLIGFWKEFDNIIYDGQEEVGTVLHYAARYGSVDSMKWLWAQPNIATDVNKVVGCYGTPLQAAILGRTDVDEKVTCLLTWGADVSREGGLTGTSLNAAAAQIKIRVAEAILEHLNEGNVNIVAGQWGSPIEAVLSANEPNLSEADVETREMMDLLISKGVSAASQGGFWHTALHAAANAHALCIVK